MCDLLVDGSLSSALSLELDLDRCLFLSFDRDFSLLLDDDCCAAACSRLRSLDVDLDLDLERDLDADLERE